MDDESLRGAQEYLACQLLTKVKKLDEEDRDLVLQIIAEENPAIFIAAAKKVLPANKPAF